MDEQPILRPAPRRPGGGFTLQPISTSSHTSIPPSENQPPSPTFQRSQTNSSLSVPSTADSSTTPRTSRSVLNLTASTLFGIYNDTPTSGFRGGGGGSTIDSDSVLSTPWGTGAQTPQRSTSTSSEDKTITAERLRERAEALAAPRRPDGSTHPAGDAKMTEQQRKRRMSMHQPGAPSYGYYSRTRTALRSIARSVILFAIGIAYGSILTQLHGSRGLAPVQVENLDRTSWLYLCFWGVSGLILGNLLPWLDQAITARVPRSWSRRAAGSGDTLSGAPIVRSIGAFVGIAFAIRRLPWQSTLQLSLTLALANPVIWYLLDRTFSGFLLSVFFSIFGASALLTINPSMLPSPIISPFTQLGGGAAGLRRNGTVTSGRGGSPDSGMGTGEAIGEYEGIAVATWIASVLFVSCVCFGNIGRRLAYEESSSRGDDGTATAIAAVGAGTNVSLDGRGAGGIHR